MTDGEAPATGMAGISKTWLMVLGGVAVTVAFLVLSALIQHTEAIWIQTRVFGLVSFVALFIVVLLGEIRLLAKDKSKVLFFRYHKPLAIFATYLVFLHFVSAVADEYKWGKALSFVQFLGFSFSDKWLVFLSLGTIAFYLMLLIGLTSARKGIQLLGFRKWKLVHFLSYLTFLIAFVHSVNLGTDLKTSVLAPFIKPVVLVMFALVTSLLLVRIINSWPVFSDQWEVNLAAAFSITILVVSAMLATHVVQQEERLQVASTRTTALEIAVNAREAQAETLKQDIEERRAQLEEVTGG
jgi:DMSO/TMAO reductase YedYZ heme-binding membrane subunit